MDSASRKTNLLEFETSTEAGEAVMQQAATLAQRAFGEHLVAAYALGSLAHGGFSVHVSDVDLGLVLADPLRADDEKSIERLKAEVKSGGAPLSDRLSVFWGTALTLQEKAAGGRFPPVDRLDLKEHGRLLCGRDIRDQVIPPTVRDMVVSAARQALASVASPGAIAGLHDPAALVEAGVRPFTKRVLFPVRFLFTARTGLIGRNDTAVSHFIELNTGPVAELALSAFKWRYEPFRPGDTAVLECARAGLLPLYRLFIDDYQARLRAYGERELERSFAEARKQLA